MHLAVLTAVKADPGWGKYRSYGSYYGHYRTPRYAQQSTPYSKFKIIFYSTYLRRDGVSVVAVGAMAHTVH